MVNDHSDREREPAANILLDQQQVIFYMNHPTERIVHTMAFDIPVMEHWMEWEIAQWVHHEGLIWQPLSGCSTMEHFVSCLLNLFEQQIIRY